MYKLFQNLKMKEVKTINFKSPKRETPFAPEWDYLICEKMINDINIKSLKNFLLKKEKGLVEGIEEELECSICHSSCLRSEPV